MGAIDMIKSFGQKIADRVKPVPLESSSSGAYRYNQHYRSYGSLAGGAKFPGGISGDFGGLFLDHRRIRQNARVAVQEVPQATALVNRYADTVVDIGLMPEPSPKADILGISQEQAEEWSRDVEERFDSWARSKESYRSEVMTFYQAQRLDGIMQQRDNDIFTRLYYSADKRLQNPLQIQFVDADQIRSDAFTTSYALHGCDDGIERNNKGVEKSYKVWMKKSDGSGYDFVSIPAKGPKSGKRMMLHQFTQEYPGQTRGFSRLAAGLQEFQNITDFSLSHIKKAIAQSSFSMYVKPSPDNPASNPLQDISNTGVSGPITDNGTAFAQTTGNSETSIPVNYCPIPEATIDTPGSVGVFNLMEGEDLKSFDGKTPVDSYDKFVDAFTSYLSAAMGMPLEVLLMKFNQNYSASRGALILFWRVAQIWREEMNADFNNPIYEAWLDGEIAAGRVSAPGWSDPVLKAAWLNCRWIGSPMPNIDPMKTATSDRMYAEMGSTNLDRIARDLNGSSGKANRAKIARQFAEIPPSPWKKGAAAPASGGKSNGKSGGDDKTESISELALEIAMHLKSLED